MKTVILGRTGLEVGVAGLGCGGGARLGLRDGAPPESAVRLIHRAVDLGVNFIDTAKMYTTEGVVGEAIQALPRDGVVISTKHHASRADGGFYSPDDIVAGLDDSLKQLRTDYVDIFHIHGLYGENYDYVTGEVLPALRREREKGKIRFLGATEYAQREHRHGSLARAMDEDLFDVVMVAFSILAQNARETVFPRAIEKNVGTLLMFVARNMFGYPERLMAKLRELAEAGEIPAWVAEEDEPLAFLDRAPGTAGLIDAAYRYARDEPGAHVVLFGTSNEKHLEANIASLNAPPLSDGDRAKIDELFAALEGVGIEPGFSRGGLVGGG